jgi:hypothetical protein
MDTLEKLALEHRQQLLQETEHERMLAMATCEQLRRERTAKMFEVGQRGDAGKFVTRPLQQWFRDLTTPIFLKLFANPKASDWIYSYRVNWDAPMTADMPDSTESREMVSHVAR